MGLPGKADKLEGRGRWLEEKSLLASLIRNQTGFRNEWIAERTEIDGESDVTGAELNSTSNIGNRPFMGLSSHVIASSFFRVFLVLSLAAEAAPSDAKPTESAKPAATAPAYAASVPKPTLAGVRYGKHGRHVLDFWKAASDQPTPLVFVIHGGGWKGGSKERLDRFADTAALLKAGISVVAINYRLMKHAEGVEPPVRAPMHDAARALQFVRSKAQEWNVDKTRIGAAGGSAGACTSLWLAYHDDLADPTSEDPIARESSRLNCAAVIGPQTTLDPKQMKEWTPNSSYGGHAFGKANFASFLADREEILPWIAEYSPYALASTDDPPVALFYNKPPAIGKAQKDPTHSANFGVKLQQRCAELGVNCELVYPGAEKTIHRTATDYLIATLKAAADAE